MVTKKSQHIEDPVAVPKPAGLVPKDASGLFDQPWQVVGDGKKEGDVTQVSLDVAAQLAMLCLNKKGASSGDKLGSSKKQAPHRVMLGSEEKESGWPMVRCDSPGCDNVDKWTIMISTELTVWVQETFDQPVDKKRFTRKCKICVMREQDLKEGAAMTAIFV